MAKPVLGTITHVLGTLGRTPVLWVELPNDYTNSCSLGTYAED